MLQNDDDDERARAPKSALALSCLQNSIALRLLDALLFGLGEGEIRTLGSDIVATVLLRFAGYYSSPGTQTSQFFFVLRSETPHLHPTRGCAHAAGSTVAFLNMLVVMTYNPGLLLAVVAGQ